MNICYYCICPFTDDEWDQRHSDAAGEDVHEECCDVCHGDDTNHRRRFDDGIIQYQK